MSATAMLAMVRKDLHLFFSDRRAVLMGFVVPIAIASFFGSIFAGGAGNTEAARVPVVFVDEDASGISKGLIESAGKDTTFTVTQADAGAAEQAVRRGTATVAVVVPKGFGDAASRAFFSAAERPELTLQYDPSHGTEMALVRGVLTQHIMETVSAEVFGGASGQQILDEQLQNVDSYLMPAADKANLKTLLEAARTFYKRRDDASAPSAPSTPSARSDTTAGTTPSRRRGLTMPYTVKEMAMTSGNKPYNGYAHSFAGMGVQFLFFAMIDLGVGILLERERGLWKRIRSAPISRLTLLAGKSLSGSLIALSTLLVSFLFAIIVFKVRIQGSLIGFALIAAATAAMACTFGLLIAALGKTPGSTRGLASLAVLMMVMLGGAWVPSFIFPRWLQQLTVVVPARWAVDGLDAMTWRGLGLEAAVLPTIMLLGFAALFGALAVARFRWDE